MIEGIDFVICKICNFHAQNLGIHLKKIHNLDVSNYDGLTVSQNSHTKYSENHFQYLKHAKENNVDLTQYWQSISYGVSKAILSNPAEIDRRSKMMHKLNDKQQYDPEFKSIISKTAIKTSARPEIQEARSKKLENWRKENPNDFYEKCIKKMINSFQSKPEKKLFEFVSLLKEFDFKRNQFIKSTNFSSLSKRRQIDIVDKNKRIYIEFDGKIHFISVFGDDVLLKNKIRDDEVEQHIYNHNWTLIRISHDQFKYATKMVNGIKQDNSYFKQECLYKLVMLLNENKPGIYKIGEAYGKY